MATRRQENPIHDWMPFYGKTFYASRYVRRMKDFQIGWYVTLLWSEWERGGYLPDDPEELWIMAGADSKEFFDKHSAIVLGRFENTGDGRLFNADLLAIYQQKVQAYEKQKTGGRSRWQGASSQPIGSHEAASAMSSISISTSSSNTSFKEAVRFELESFDLDPHYQRLLDVSPNNREDCHAVNVAFMDAIEWCVEKKGLSRADSAVYIIDKSAKYNEAKGQFCKSLEVFLRRKMFEQTWSDDGRPDKAAIAKRALGL